MWAPSRKCLSQATPGRPRHRAGARPTSDWGPSLILPHPHTPPCIALLGPPHTTPYPLSYHTHLAEKEEGGPMCDPGIRAQPLYPLQPIPHRSR